MLFRSGAVDAEPGLVVHGARDADDADTEDADDRRDETGDAQMSDEVNKPGLAAAVLAQARFKNPSLVGFERH